MRLFNISAMIERASGKSGTYYQLCNQRDYVSQPTASEEWAGGLRLDIWIFLVIQENVSSSEIWENSNSIVSWYNPPGCWREPSWSSQILVQHRCPLCQCSSSTGWFGVNSVRLGDMESQGGSEHLHLHQRFHHHGPCDGFVDKADILLEFCPYQTEYHFSHWSLHEVCLDKLFEIVVYT